jgi:hypothetical protein
MKQLSALRDTRVPQFGQRRSATVGVIRSCVIAPHYSMSCWSVNKEKEADRVKPDPLLFPYSRLIANLRLIHQRLHFD